MKVVLFCGGLGLRLREHSESLPKPMVTVGDRPILWHVMRYYAPTATATSYSAWGIGQT